MVLGDKRRISAMNTSAAAAALPGGVPGEKDQFRFVPAAAHSQRKDKLPGQRERRIQIRRASLRIGQRCQQPYISSSKAPSKGGQ